MTRQSPFLMLWTAPSPASPCRLPESEVLFRVNIQLAQANSTAMGPVYCDIDIKLLGFVFEKALKVKQAPRGNTYVVEQLEGQPEDRYRQP